MSGIGSTDESGLPVVPVALMPPDVRAAGVRGERLYEACLGFEQMLTTQLTTSITQTMDGGDQSGDGSDGNGGSGSIFAGGGDATTSLYGQMLPGALSQGLTQAGGIGLADELYRAMALSAGIEPRASTGGGSGGSAAGS